MFGFPDGIRDMTRSLEMLEPQRSIYWKAIFGHRKGSEWFGHFAEYQEVTETPREKLWALWAIRRKHTSPQGAGAPPFGQEAELE